MSNQLTLPFVPKPKRWHRPVAWLLWLANSDAPHWGQHRFAFYSLKDAILADRATEDGIDWQQINHPCWGCDGSGYWTHWSGDRDICHRCCGSGIYSRTYVPLHRLRFGGRVFHRPGESQRHAPETERELINGRIRHRRKGRVAVMAFAVLLAIFDRPQLRKLAWLVMWERCEQIAWRIARWLPVRCHGCQCLMIRKDAAATLTSHTKTLGYYCGRCNEQIPF